MVMFQSISWPGRLPGNQQKPQEVITPDTNLVKTNNI